MNDFIWNQPWQDSKLPLKNSMLCLCIPIRRGFLRGLSYVLHVHVIGLQTVSSSSCHHSGLRLDTSYGSSSKYGCNAQPHEFDEPRSPRGLKVIWILETHLVLILLPSSISAFSFHFDLPTHPQSLMYFILQLQWTTCYFSIHSANPCDSPYQGCSSLIS